jgi:hypothetical protein
MAMGDLLSLPQVGRDLVEAEPGAMGCRQAGHHGLIRQGSQVWDLSQYS